MAPSLPEPLDHDRHVVLHHRGIEPWLRRSGLAVFAAVVIAALAGVFGQSERVTAAAAPAADLRVAGPAVIRGGLFFQGRVDVVARRRLDHPVLVFDRGWNEQLQVNTIEPAAEAESSEDGRMRLDYGPLDPGERLTVWLQFEANPTGTGRRDQDVELRDGPDPLARVDRTLTILP